jgi:glucose/arabinose dehydrogenase
MKPYILFLISCSLACWSCSGEKNSGNSNNADSDTTSVETGKPNTSYTPAFKGQTRVKGITTKAKHKGTIITSELDRPWGIISMPDGRFLLTEKAGKMRIVTAEGNIGEPIAGVPKVNDGGQGGLLGLCLDPDFPTNRMVYWAFSEPGAQGNVTAIAKGRLSDNESALEQVTVIYRANPRYSGNLHYGSRLVFDKSGYLFATTGERSDMETRPQAQSVTSGLGKLIRITKDGAPAPDNPFAGQGNALPELYSIGHRNPQGLAFHPETGDLWLNEFGPRGGDELNLIRAGANYGWPIITYGIEYSGETIGEGIQQKEGLEQPVYYWDPVISPSGMTFYSGDRMAEWNNNLFISCLSGMHIVRLVIENNKVVGEERLLANENQRFRDITQGMDGALYAITDQGRLYRIDKE